MKRTTLVRLRKYRIVYLLILVPFLSVFLFRYLPMLGIVMAFKKYRLGSGFAGMFTSPGIGLDHFRDLFASAYFGRVMRNTLVISFLKIIFIFPAPIILALMLNELRALWYKRTVQTVSYLPHFLSTVIIQGLVMAILSPSYGLVNGIRIAVGLDVHHYIADPRFFRGIIVTIDLWRGVGWGAIIYLAAIAGINPELYEAATIDGASRLRQAWHITVAGIAELIVLLLILRVGDILDAGFELIFLLYSPLVYSVGDIIDTYTYRVGLLDANFGFGTAVGLFKSVVGFVLVIGTNRLAKRFGRQGIW
jgi:putative aldouronate transport system permease protein